jgi:hypothetical protein
VPLKPLLTPRQPVQQLAAATPHTSGALRGFVLESAAQTSKVIPAAANVAPIPALPLARVGNIGASQIHAKDIRGCVGRRDGSFDLDMDSIGAIAVLAQLGTGGLVSLQLPALVVPQHQAKVYAAVQQGETHAPIACSERANALVVLDAGGIKGFNNITPGLGGLAG